MLWLGNFVLVVVIDSTVIASGIIPCLNYHSGAPVGMHLSHRESTNCSTELCLIVQVIGSTFLLCRNSCVRPGI